MYKLQVFEPNRLDGIEKFLNSGNWEVEFMFQDGRGRYVILAKGAEFPKGEPAEEVPVEEEVEQSEGE